MTVATTTTSITVQGDGLTSIFNYDFPMGGSSSYAQLVYIDSNGNEVALSTSSFSITGVTDQDGGTFTYPLSGSPIGASVSLRLSRVLPLTQTADIGNQGNFYPSVVEGALDYLTMLAQQVPGAGLLDAASLFGNTLSVPGPGQSIGLGAGLSFSGGTLVISGITGSGTVTQVNTGAGLTGGPITGVGTIAIATGGVTTGAIASSAVVTASILNTAVSYAKVQNVAASSLVGNPATTSTTMSEISLGTGLAFTGSSLVSSVMAFSQTAATTVSNTTSETTLVGAGLGSVTLTASFLTVGKTLQIRASGFHSATALPTLNMKFKLGSTTVSATGNVTTTTASNTYWEATADIVCISTGAGGAVFAQGKFIEAGVTPFGMVNTTSVAINTTGSLAVGLTAQWSAASVTNSISCTNLSIMQTG